MRGATYTFLLGQPLGPSAISVLESIPGVRAAGASEERLHGPWPVTAPWHAGWITDNTLREWGLSATIIPPAVVGGDFPTPEQLPEIDPDRLVDGIPVRERLTTFQREGLRFFQERGGGLAHWVCGSGKTVLGLLWALSYRDRAIIITRSTTVPQWRDEVEKWCRPGAVHVETIEGTSGYGIEYKDPPRERTLQIVQEERERPVQRSAFLFDLDEVRRRAVLFNLKVTGDESPRKLEPYGLARSWTEQERYTVPKEVKGWRTLDAGWKSWRVRSYQQDRIVAAYDTQMEAEADVRMRDGFLDVPPETRIVVIGWAVLSARRRALLQWAAGTVVCDESHRAKQYSRWIRTTLPDDTVEYEAKKNASASAMLLCHRAARTLLLTATPMPDRVRDLWAQADLYDPRSFGKKFRIYADRYCDGHTNVYGHYMSDGTTQPEELSARMSFFTHVVTKSQAHAALPPLTRTVVTLAPKELAGRMAPKTWVKKQRAPEEDVGVIIHEGAGPAPERKAGGAMALLEARSQLAAEVKRPYLAKQTVDFLVEDGFKVCVFTGRHESCERLHADIVSALIKADRPDIKVWLSHGGTHSAVERRALVRDEIFPHPGPCALVGTMDAFCEAIDGLHDTDRVLCGYIPWNLLLEQFEGRFSRHGSKRRTIIIYPKAQYTVDEPILDTLLGKAQEARAVLPSETLAALARDLSGDSRRAELLESLANKLLAAEDDREQGWLEAVQARDANWSPVPLDTGEEMEVGIAPEGEVEVDEEVAEAS